MPSSIPLAAFVFGGMLLLVAILGGGFTGLGFEVSGPVGVPLRVVAGAVGTVFVAGGVYLTLNPDLTSESNTSAGGSGPSVRVVTAPPTTKQKPRAEAPRVVDQGLEVDYSVNELGSDVYIGSTGDYIVVVTEPTLHWEYRKCPELTTSNNQAPVVQYRYTVMLSKSDNSKLLDSRSFKYANGEVDRFLIELRFPGRGIYTTWFSLQYKDLGDTREHVYKTEKEPLEVCAKWTSAEW